MRALARIREPGLQDTAGDSPEFVESEDRYEAEERTLTRRQRRRRGFPFQPWPAPPPQAERLGSLLNLEAAWNAIGHLRQTDRVPADPGVRLDARLGRRAFQSHQRRPVRSWWPSYMAAMELDVVKRRQAQPLDPRFSAARRQRTRMSQRAQQPRPRWHHPIHIDDLSSEALEARHQAAFGRKPR